MIEENLNLEANAAYKKGDYGAALELYKGVADSRTRIRFALCLLLTGESADAVSLLEEVTRDEPQNFLANTALACAFEVQGNLSEAGKWYRTVISSSSSSGLAYLNLGYLMFIHGNTQGAANCLQQCLDAPPTSIPVPLHLPSFDLAKLPKPPPRATDRVASNACLMLGLKLQEAGRFDLAASCFHLAIGWDRLNFSVYGALAASRKLTNQDQPFINSLIQLSKGPNLARPDRARLYFSLGKAFDDLQDYETAISYYDAAHQEILAEATPYNQPAFQAEVDSIIEKYDLSTSNAQEVSGSDSAIPLLIVGMMRSGTSLVEQILSSHPEVAAGDELAFWRDFGFRQLGAGVRPPSKDEAAQIADEYLKLLQTIDPDAARITDKMPHNFLAVGLIHRIFPNARIVCCRRNPIDTCLSIYMTDFRHPIPFANKREDLAFFYRQFERLAAHWRKVIPADRYLEIHHEDVLGKREETTRRLVDFCGLEWDDNCLAPEKNLRPVKTASVVQVRQSVHATDNPRWKRFEPWLGALAGLADQPQ